MTGGRTTRRDAIDGGVPRRTRRSRPARPRRRAATSLAAGTVLIVAAALAWMVGHPVPAGQTVSSVGASDARALTAAEPDSAESISSGPGPVDPGLAEPDAVETGLDETSVAETSVAETATGPTPSAAAPGPPSRLRVPTLAVDAPVTPVGVTDGGDVQVPDDVGTVGWYRFGPDPGAPGSAVLIGHVDNYRQGVGVLARIGDLNPGDGIEIADDDGDVRTFTVVAREQWTKAQAPLGRLFDRGGSSRLVLITCGGAFDDSRLEYTDTIAVTAIPTTA